ncbi:Putative Flp pilus-assembly TadE/G-like [Devosia enhydra]|uniref:Putative Flp pilus-assembly TadE/G-like n=1 Tax=Devosia enhydra TaxID=665118 RepID=A0A1K2HW84_9HYPH|nr:pilus assembly protein TadG-related protein [Devosia enhydra]SFZ83233.1 Putative Flp pilus-assembly TadE/G-like [Devosia enhydra]
MRFSSARAICALVSRFGTDRSGSVALVAAIVLPALLGAAALVGEYGNALLHKAENQRVADLASYAGALAYIENSSEEEMLEAARRIASLNGVDPAAVSAVLVGSPRTEGANAVRVEINTSHPLILAQVLGTGPEVGAAAGAFTELGTASTPGEEEEEAGAGGCIVALAAGGSGITLSGGTSITANDCVVSSNNSLAVPCGTTIRALQVTYNGASPNVGCGGIQKPDGSAGDIKKGETADPLAGNATIAAAVGRMSSVSALTAPAAPAAPSFATTPSGGKAIDFAYNDNSTKAQAIALGCTAAKSGNTWTLTCPNGGTYNFSNVTTGGGINLNFATSGSGTSTYNISGAVSVAGGQTWTFGPGTYNFGGAFTNNSTVTFQGGTLNFLGNFTHSGSSTTLPAGALKVGGNFGLTSYGTATINSSSIHVGGLMSVTGSVSASVAATSLTLRQGLLTDGSAALSVPNATSVQVGATSASCNWDAGTVSICQKGTTITFGASANFQLTAGVYLSGGVTLNMGAADGNSYRFGAASLGAAIKIGGGSKLLMGDATTGVFQMAGNIDGGGGGSCLVIGAATDHDIKGNFTAAGAIWLGNGTYTVTGYFWMGASNGGSATCKGQTISVRGDAVTLVIDGAGVPTTGTCANQSFCVGAGYSNIILSAPSTGSFTDLVIVGPQSTSNSSGATFKEGASGGKFSGAFYYPNGPIQMTGGAGASGGATCMQMIATWISLSGGTSAASECRVGGDLGGGGSGTGTGGSEPVVVLRPRLIQ